MAKMMMVAWGLSMAVLGAAATVSAAESRGEVSFKDDIKPVIQIRCLECHQPGGKGFEESGLSMESYESLMKGTKHGPVIEPKSIMRSNLIRLIDGSADIRMPHDRQRLTDCEIQLFKTWISQGAQNN